MEFTRKFRHKKPASDDYLKPIMTYLSWLKRTVLPCWALFLLFRIMDN
ncbi:hypothetical protein XBJ2_430002 [Xenorhabdus bovienii str. Jollieti]|uniref:Uncharacterized protein n=1 Tax=Xenorhabdus bovienii (strain SS-2004) TaxID=406818 RepID=D3UZJ7_XENBS|nr:hypothetical protein XBJ1_0885 [Xenorhabdus bovienii SS-2004]CDH29741.1 hypothetical protein XBJ2_430002 [Xenorhabdus bovienii str. Jollieti]